MSKLAAIERRAASTRDVRTMENIMIKLLLAAVFLAPAAGFASTPTATSILAAARTASGGQAWHAVHNLRMTTRMKDVTSVTLVDLRTGNMVTHDQGATPSASGVVGGASWHTDMSGTAVATVSPARRKARVTDAYCASFGWWYPKRAAASITLIGQKTHANKDYWVLKITPHDGLSFTLWIDSQSMLVARRVEHLGPYAVIVDVSDYRSVHGIKLPFARQTVRVYGGQQHVSTAKVQAVAINVAAKASDFAMPQHP